MAGHGHGLLHIGHFEQGADHADVGTKPQGGMVQASGGRLQLDLGRIGKASTPELAVGHQSQHPGLPGPVQTGMG
ncbi:MAG: hypothetical protein BWX54_00991 [Verrucomicrobia bacterium ADurb.Bin018]|nr:MAG: hypothetical protein BWX54_00991 [Verrucomicrobia bacterium ADurb.Bin018]